MTRDVLDRIVDKIDFHDFEEDACWTMSTGKRHQTFLRKDESGKSIKAWTYRLVWGLTVEELPDDRDMVLDHLCRNPACIRVDHLELVTRLENFARGKHVGPRNTDTCRSGKHAWIPENQRTNSSGNLFCVPCRQEWERRAYWEERGEPDKTGAISKYTGKCRSGLHDWMPENLTSDGHGCRLCKQDREIARNIAPLSVPYRPEAKEEVL